MLKAVFFDVGNTLLYPYPGVSEVCRQVLAEAGHLHDLEVIDSLMPLVDAYYEDRYRADDTFWTDEEQTSDVWVGMYSLMCRKLGIDESAVILARRVYDEFGRADRWRVYEDVVPAFKRLRDRGLKLGIISNWDRRLVRLVDGLGLASYLDSVISSADTGMRKPDPRIFELACRELGVEPAEAAHVGDHHYADVLGARAVGMQAVLIDRHDGEILPVGLRPIGSLDVIEDALGL
ncbi:MAG: HAD-IA family hydrolase [Coriobacteriia bacterium]|nr:HAD-IA family hydrolase [Coriobacteriia bacterium]